MRPEVRQVGVKPPLKCDSMQPLFLLHKNTSDGASAESCSYIHLWPLTIRLQDNNPAQQSPPARRHGDHSLVEEHLPRARIAILIPRVASSWSYRHLNSHWVFPSCSQWHRFNKPLTYFKSTESRFQSCQMGIRTYDRVVQGHRGGFPQER